MSQGVVMSKLSKRVIVLMGVMFWRRIVLRVTRVFFQGGDVEKSFHLRERRTVAYVRVGDVNAG